jgi:hypothetical protein
VAVLVLIIVVIGCLWYVDYIRMQSNKTDFCKIDWSATGSMLSAWAFVATAIVAGLGLNSWRSQRRAQYKMELVSAVHEGIGFIKDAMNFDTVIMQTVERYTENMVRDEKERDNLNRQLQHISYFTLKVSSNHLAWARIKAVSDRGKAVLPQQLGSAIDKILEVKVALEQAAIAITDYFDDMVLKKPFNGTLPAQEYSLGVACFQSRRFVAGVELAGGRNDEVRIQYEHLHQLLKEAEKEAGVIAQSAV